MTFSLPPLPVARYQSRPTDGALSARVSRDAPRVPWDKFTRNTLKWQAGEHVALIGPTGQGKTTLLLELLPHRPYVVVLATKPKDSTMDRLVASGYTKMPRWNSLNHREEPRRIVWPDARRLDSVPLQRQVFQQALADIYREGGWTVAIDELWFFSNVLKLEHEVKLYLLQGRSLGISLVAGTQRPAWVPLELYDQSTHLFFWRDNDETNLSRISSINVRSRELIRHIVSNLERHQVLYVNTRTGVMARTRVPRPKG